MTEKQTNPGGLPYGMGSIQKRGRVWWLIYRDTAGKTIQENSFTEDQDAAANMLARRALAKVEAQRVLLREILNGRKASRGKAGERGGRAGSRSAANRSVGVAARNRAAQTAKGAAR